VIAERLVLTRHSLDAHDLRSTRAEFPIEWSPMRAIDLAPQLVPIDEGRLAVVVHADGRVCSLDLATGEAWWVKDGRTGEPIADVAHVVQVHGTASPVAFITRNGRALITDAGVRMAIEGVLLALARGAIGRLPFFAAAWHRPAKILVCGMEDGRVVRIARGAVHVLGAHADMVLAVRIDAEHGTVICTSDDGAVIEWSLLGGKRQQWLGAGLPLTSAARDGQGGLVACSATGTVLRWPKQESRSPRTAFDGSNVIAASVTDRGVAVLALQEERAIEVWNTRDGVRVAVLDPSASDAEDVAFVDDGNRVVAHVRDEFREWEVVVPTAR
jgi:hypothetical protein